MTVVRESLVIDAPPREVWRILADPRNLPRWNRHIHAVRDVPNGLLKQGDRYSTELRIMGVTLRVDAKVEETREPVYACVQLSGPLEATVRTWVRPVGSRRTRVEHEVDYRFKGGPLGALVAQAVRLAGAPTILRRGIRAQKRQVEGG